MLQPRQKPDTLQGTLDLLVLKTLSGGPQHGFGLAARIREISGDVLRVEEGSLYPALRRMEHAGWVQAEWSVTANQRRARLYRLTRAGRTVLAGEARRWQALTVAVGKVLRFA